jgi:hypothetical protein
MAMGMIWYRWVAVLFALLLVHVELRRWSWWVAAGASCCSWCGRRVVVLEMIWYRCVDRDVALSLAHTGLKEDTHMGGPDTILNSISQAKTNAESTGDKEKMSTQSINFVNGLGA